MIKHFFKLTWNKKKRHSLLVVELFFAYLVTSFLVFFYFTTPYYLREKPNYNTDNLIAIQISSANDTVMQNLKAIKEVKDISLTDYQPYHNTWLRGFDKLQYGNVKTPDFNTSFADEHLQSTLGLSMKSGRWFEKKDRSSVPALIIINEHAKDLLFPKIQAEGRIVKLGKKEYQIVGVVKNLNDPTTTTGSFANTDVFVLDEGEFTLIKLNTPINNAIYNKLKKAIAGFRNQYSDVIHPAEEYRQQYLAQSTFLITIMGGLSLFLIINVVLGLFSILYQNINKRKPEIGLRRAAGAAEGQIYMQIVMEVLLLASIALIPGVIIAYQFVLFKVFGENAHYSASLIVGGAIIYILVTLCALYPAKLASKIQPAEALHEE